MAGDWIVWVKGLSSRREVIAIHNATGRPRREIACILMELWEWADNETDDGFIPDICVRNLSAFVADTCPEFWRTVADVGWLVERDGGLFIPHFDRWMGHSARRRLKEMQRKRNNRNKEKASRNACGQTGATHADIEQTKAGPEIEIENKEEYPPTPLQGGKAEEGVASQTSTQPKAEEPPPSSARPPSATNASTNGVDATRRVMPCDHPDLDPTVQRIRQHYRATVKSTQHEGAFRKSIVERLITGQSEESLKHCADAYAAQIKRADTAPAKRQALGKFYSDDGAWEGFLDSQDQPPIRPKKTTQTQRTEKPIRTEEPIRLADAMRQPQVSNHPSNHPQ